MRLVDLLLKIVLVFVGISFEMIYLNGEFECYHNLLRNV